ncbi:MAG: hypothetical protein ABIH71_05910 [Candidatus Omnitrophota bacterium]
MDQKIGRKKTIFRTFRCGDDVEVLCGCLPAKALVAGVSGRFGGSGRDAGAEVI